MLRRIARVRMESARAERESQYPDRDLLAVLFLFWLTSMARVIVGVARHEDFGAEGTLALLTVLLGPWLMRDVATRWFGRHTSSRESSKKPTSRASNDPFRSRREALYLGRIGTP